MRVSIPSASNMYKLKNKLDPTVITYIISRVVLSTGITPQTVFSFIKKTVENRVILYMYTNELQHIFLAISFKIERIINYGCSTYGQIMIFVRSHAIMKI